MPTQDELDQKAADYGFYVDKINKLKDQEAALVKSIADLEGAKVSKTDELEQHNAAVTRLHDEVLTLEKEISDLKVRKEQEAVIDRSVAEQQRKANNEEAARLSAFSDELDRRASALDGRERQVKEGFTMIDAKERALVDATAKVDAQKTELEKQMTSATARHREADTKMQEIQTLIRKNTDIEASAQSALAQAKEHRLAAEEAAGRAKNDLGDATHNITYNEKLLSEVKTLIPVMQEFHKFVTEHISNPDAINAYMKEKFPLAADAVL